MSKITKLRHNLIHFNKKLASFKYLKLLYFAAFAVGLTASVYVQNQATNLLSKAENFDDKPKYIFFCDKNNYMYNNCNTYINTDDEKFHEVLAESPQGTCWNNNRETPPKSHKLVSCTRGKCVENCEVLTPSPTLAPTLTPTRKPTKQPTATPPNSPTPQPTTRPTATSAIGRCTGNIANNASAWSQLEDNDVPSGNLEWKFSANNTDRKCQFKCNTGYIWNQVIDKCETGLGSGVTLTATPRPTNTQPPLTNTLRPPTNTPRPTATPTPVPGTKGCGISCGSTSECQSGFTCKDVNSGGNVCWNDGICGGPALKSRIEGIVRGCNNQPLPNVPVWAWGNVDYTDQSGKFQLNKGVSRNSEGDITLNETTIKAGFDATLNTSTGVGYFDNGTGRQYDALQLRSGNSCGLVNCLFSNRVGDGLNISDSHKLMVGGPARTAYRLGRRSTNPNQGLTDELFEYNFVFTDYHAGKFNFKQVNCPTSVPPTLTAPPLLRCNEQCTSDAQCQNANPSWYCATQWNYSGWSLRTSEFIASGNGLTSSGKITGMNNHMSANLSTLEQHVVKNNEVYYRTKPAAQSGWTTAQVFQNVNDYVKEVGCSALGYVGDACINFKNQYKIIDFNSFIYTASGKKITQQHLLRSNGTYTYIFSRNNEFGWSSWANVSSNLSGIGSISGANNVITSFSTYVTNDNYWLQTLVRGGRVYQRQLGLYGWVSTTSTFNSCTGSQTYVENGVTKTGNGSCGSNPNGSNPIITYKPIKLNDGKVIAYIARKDGNVYWLTSYPNGEKCRLKSSPWNTNCGATPTPVP